MQKPLTPTFSRRERAGDALDHVATLSFPLHELPHNHAYAVVLHLIVYLPQVVPGAIFLAWDLLRGRGAVGGQT